MGAFKRAVPKGKPKAGKRSKADPPVSRVKPAAAKSHGREARSRFGEDEVDRQGRASFSAGEGGERVLAEDLAEDVDHAAGRLCFGACTRQAKRARRVAAARAAPAAERAGGA